jgi:hypothetical protein
MRALHTERTKQENKLNYFLRQVALSSTLHSFAGADMQSQMRSFTRAKFHIGTLSICMN